MCVCVCVCVCIYVVKTLSVIGEGFFVMLTV